MRGALTLSIVVLDVRFYCTNERLRFHESPWGEDFNQIERTKFLERFTKSNFLILLLQFILLLSHETETSIQKWADRRTEGRPLNRHELGRELGSPLRLHLFDADYLRHTNTADDNHVPEKDSQNIHVFDQRVQSRDKSIGVKALLWAGGLGDLKEMSRRKVPASQSGCMGGATCWIPSGHGGIEPSTPAASTSEGFSGSASGYLRRLMSG